MDTSNLVGAVRHPDLRDREGTILEHGREERHLVISVRPCPAHYLAIDGDYPRESAVSSLFFLACDRIQEQVMLSISSASTLVSTYHIVVLRGYLYRRLKY